MQTDILVTRISVENSEDCSYMKFSFDFYSFPFVVSGKYISEGYDITALDNIRERFPPFTFFVAVV